MRLKLLSSNRAGRVVQTIAASGLAVACLINLASMLEDSWKRGGTSYIGMFDAKFGDIRSELAAAHSTESVGYLLDAPFEKLPNEIQGYYLQARYGLAPINVRPATADDAFVILDARARLEPSVPSRLRIYKDLGDGIFLLKAAK